MMRLTLICLLATTLVLPGLCAAAKRKNVLFIAVDDLRPESDAFGVGVVKTPNIDRLASWGTTFTRAYTQISLCSPSRTSLLSSRRPDTTRVWTIGPYFRDEMPQGRDVVTLPQFFKEHGYHTVGAGKVFHPGTSSGGPSKSEGGGDMPYSWSAPYFFCDQFYNGTFQSTAAQQWPHGTGCVQSPECIACLERHHAIGNATFKPSWEAPDCPHDCFPDGAVATETIRLLSSASASPDTPFFIASGLKRPHLGWFAPASSYARFPNASVVLARHRTPPEDMPAVAFSGNGEIGGMQDVHDLMYTSTEGYSLVPDWKQHELRRGYYSSVSFMDSQLGRVLDELERLNLRNSTIIAFWGDHGYHLGEQGIWCKQTNFEHGTRVPLIIVDPSAKEGQRSTEPVELLDVYPTIVESAGFRVPTDLEGVSLAPLLANPMLKNYSTFALSQYPRANNTMGLSLRTSQWRYTFWCHFDYLSAQPLWSEQVGRELYDHRGDAGTNFDEYENVNLANRAEYANTVQQLHDQLRAVWDNNRKKRLRL